MRGYSAQRRSPPQSERNDPTSPAAAMGGAVKGGGFAAADAQAARNAQRRPVAPQTQPNFFVKDYQPVKYEAVKAEEERKHQGGVAMSFEMGSLKSASKGNKAKSKGASGRGGVNRSAVVASDRASSAKKPQVPLKKTQSQVADEEEEKARQREDQRRKMRQDIETRRAQARAKNQNQSEIVWMGGVRHLMGSESEESPAAKAGPVSGAYNAFVKKSPQQRQDQPKGGEVVDVFAPKSAPAKRVQSGKRKPAAYQPSRANEQRLKDDRKRKEWNVQNEKSDTYSELPGPSRRVPAAPVESEPETLQREEDSPTTPVESRLAESEEKLEQLEMQ